MGDPIVQFQGRGGGRGGRGRGGSTRGSYRKNGNNGGQDNHKGNANGDGTGTTEKPKCTLCGGSHRTLIFFAKNYHNIDPMAIIRCNLLLPFVFNVWEQNFKMQVNVNMVTIMHIK